MLNYQIKTQNIAYSATFLVNNRRKLSSEDKKRDLPKRTGPFTYYIREFNYSSTAACAAARRAIGTRKGEQDA